MKPRTLIPSVILTTLASTALDARAQYTAYDLGPGYAWGINSAGTVVGVSSSTGHAFSYSGGVMTDHGTLGGTSSFAYGINDAGIIVGSSDLSGDSYQHAFSYSGGYMTDLGTLGGTQSSTYGINDAGTLVGWSWTSGNSAQHAFSYSGGAMTDLGTLGGGNSTALGINGVGTIIGWSYTAGGSTARLQLQRRGHGRPRHPRRHTEPGQRHQRCRYDCGAELDHWRSGPCL